MMLYLGNFNIVPVFRDKLAKIFSFHRVILHEFGTLNNVVALLEETVIDRKTPDYSPIQISRKSTV